MLKIDEASPVPIYLQIVEGVKREIMAGVYPPDHRLPSIRDLALELKVNPNTIAKAFQELGNQKLIYFRRGQGAFAARIEKEERMRTFHAEIATRFGEIIDLAGEAGISHDDLLELFQKLFQECSSKKAGGKS